MALAGVGDAPPAAARRPGRTGLVFNPYNLSKVILFSRRDLIFERAQFSIVNTIKPHDLRRGDIASKQI